MPFPDNSCQPGNPPSGYPPYSFLGQSGNGFDNQSPHSPAGCPAGSQYPAESGYPSGLRKNPRSPLSN